MPPAAKTAVLVAGGYGIAPLFGLALKIRAMKKPAVLFYGAKDKSALFYLNEFKSIGAKIYITTEDGSHGERGVITYLLKKRLPDIKKPVFYACGPRGLLETVAKIGIDKSIPTEVSMEAYMACGMGVCMGCVCKNSNGDYVRTCKEGPVFDVNELKWR